MSCKMFPSGILTKILYGFIIFPIRASFYNYLFLLDLIALIVSLFGERAHMLKLLMLFSQPFVSLVSLSLVHPAPTCSV